MANNANFALKYFYQIKWYSINVNCAVSPVVTDAKASPLLAHDNQFDAISVTIDVNNCFCDGLLEFMMHSIGNDGRFTCNGD